jgi:hypothetical protein
MKGVREQTFRITHRKSEDFLWTSASGLTDAAFEVPRGKAITATYLRPEATRYFLADVVLLRGIAHAI